MNRTNPIIRNIAIILVSSMLASFYIITGNASREYPSIENLQLQISQINDQVEIVSQKADLPLLPNIWHSITVIASTHGVKVSPLKQAKDAGILDSDIPGGTPWYGVIQGNSRNVAIAAIEIQKVVPVIFGAAAIDNEVIGLSFAALGSELEN
tara:strand:- start:8972 stop:9430 length:459 start_codon:yes stop_codon:yes gene_type:complete